MRITRVNEVYRRDPAESVIAEILLYGMEEKRLALAGLGAAATHWWRAGVDPQQLDSIRAGGAAIATANRLSYPVLAMRSSGLLTDAVGRALLQVDALAVGHTEQTMSFPELAAYLAQPIAPGQLQAEVLYVGLWPTQDSTVYPPDASVYIPQTGRVRQPHPAV